MADEMKVRAPVTIADLERMAVAEHLVVKKDVERLQEIRTEIAKLKEEEREICRGEFKKPEWMVYLDDRIRRALDAVDGG